MLSKDTVKKLREVKAAILANPKFYNQDVYAVPVNNEEICGTVCCLAGWVDFLHFGPEDHERHAKEMFFDWWINARDILGLDINQAEIFSMADGCHPDERFNEEYQEATTDTARAKAAAAMIDRFIKNEGTFPEA